MAVTLNETPSANRLHIGIFGKTNSGKSSFINAFSGQKVPEMTPEIVQGISDRYIELFENITGEKFVKEDTSNIAARIEKNVMDFLKK